MSGWQQAGGWSKAGTEVLGWSVGVGVGMQVGYIAVRFLQHRLFGGSEWFAKLSSEDQQKTAGRVTTIIHHLAVTAGSVYSLYKGDSSLMHKIFLLEMGFDISDSFNTIVGIGGMTSLAAVPLLLHHGVAVALEVGYLMSVPIVPWRTAAAFTTILLGSGAVDLLMVKIIPRTPLYKSKYLWHATLAEFLVFLGCRVGYFLYAGSNVLYLAWQNGNVPLMVSSGLGLTLLSLYHMLLGMGLWKSLKRGGEIPELQWKD